MAEPEKETFCRRTRQVAKDMEDVSSIELELDGQMLGAITKRELRLCPRPLVLV
jgi:hypothetical protein